ncbi:hypothetical protein EVAR_5919_1 [Eumeta japonica]|uniref:Uncharacterized protein n=1 Tax=Eumeta variegata TaxID=151549 RepID=A0A4C1TC96_EUMVA|nr:hypothetical protein EVAR_5919_1 [Eumeta japonica]
MMLPRWLSRCGFLFGWGSRYANFGIAFDWKAWWCARCACVGRRKPEGASIKRKGKKDSACKSPESPASAARKFYEYLRLVLRVVDTARGFSCERSDLERPVRNGQATHARALIDFDEASIAKIGQDHCTNTCRAVDAFSESRPAGFDMWRFI